MPSQSPGPVRSVLVIEPSADLYGAGRTVLAVCAEFVHRGYHVHVWSAEEGSLQPALRAAGADPHIVDIPVLRRQEWRGAGLATAPFRLLADMRRARREARALQPRPHVVHSLALPSLAGLSASRALGCPLSWSVHEVVRSRPERMVFGRLLRRADVVFGCSRMVAEQFPGITAQVIYSGADLAALARIPTVPTLERQIPEIICVGRLNRWKGQDVLIRALGQLHGQGIDFRASIVGGAYVTDADVEAELRRLVDELGLTDRVAFLGERTDAKELVGQADIAVVPSKVAEPFGKTVIEAMALGRPIVSTDAGGPREVIRHGVDGLLVPPGDDAALADALRQLIDAPGFARQLAAAGVERARDFDEADAAKEYVDAMERLVAKGSPRYKRHR